MISQRGHILVVDDNENNRELLARRLKRQGYSVAVADHGRTGLELVRTAPFDMVLLDIMMPEMDGYEVLAQLKADPLLRHIPVIMISALDDIDSVVRCIEMGAEDYLFKPFNPVLLQARIGAGLEKKRLRDQEQAYLRSVKQELELGRRTQADFLPAELPCWPGWEIAAAFHPAREVAGDFYDAFLLPGDRIGLVIADVCDKGVGAALFMALVRSLVRAFAEKSDPATDEALDAVRLTNSYIARHHHRNRTHVYATLFFGLLDPHSGVLTYINGGHPPPVLLGSNGATTPLDPTGPAVGMMAASTFRVAQATIAPGESLLAYTDGVTEARDSGGNLFGEERLLATLEPPPPSVVTLMERIETAVRGHVGHDALADDITMLAVRRAC